MKLTEEQVADLRSKHGWAKETIRAIEAEVLRGITGGGRGDEATIAGLESATGHLSVLVDDLRALMARAMANMKALHDASKPIDESGGDFDARVPCDAFRRFVDEHAALLCDLHNSPHELPATPPQQEQAGAVMDGLLRRAEELHEKAGMPWAEAEELALSEAGIEDSHIDELVGNTNQATIVSLLSEEEVREFTRTILIYGQPLLSASPAAPTQVETQATCTFPNCKCPMDPGPDPDWCAIGLPHAAPSTPPMEPGQKGEA